MRGKVKSNSAFYSCKSITRSLTYEIIIGHQSELCLTDSSSFIPGLP